MLIIVVILVFGLVIRVVLFGRFCLSRVSVIGFSFMCLIIVFSCFIV